MWKRIQDQGMETIVVVLLEEIDLTTTLKEIVENN